MQVLKPEWLWTADGVHQGWEVEVDGGSILGVGPATRHNKRVVELPGKLLVPGFVNAHSHAFQRAFRGTVQWSPDDRDDFWSWRQAMYDVANGLGPEGVYAVSRLAFLEMIEAGITTVGEFHYLHHAPDGTRYDDPDLLARRVIAAARDVGLRIALLRVAYARSGPGEPVGPGQRRFADRSPDEVLAAAGRLAALDEPGVTIGIAPHSVRAVPVDWLEALASWPGVVHSHVAEQPRDVRTCHDEHGRPPLRVLADAGLVTERFTAVHLTWPDQADVDLLVEAGARVCVCPTTELDLGDGFLPVDVRRAPLCVGTDSQARIDMFAEVRALELHARALAGRRNVMSPPGRRHGLAARLLEAATLQGARALGTGVTDGPGVTAGVPADLVAIDLDRVAAAAVPPLEAAVFGGSPDWVTDVWVAGERVVRGGRHPRREEIVAAYLRQQQR